MALCLVLLEFCAVVATRQLELDDPPFEQQEVGMVLMSYAMLWANVFRGSVVSPAMAAVGSDDHTTSCTSNIASAPVAAASKTIAMTTAANTATTTTTIFTFRNKESVRDTKVRVDTVGSVDGTISSNGNGNCNGVPIVLVPKTKSKTSGTSSSGVRIYAPKSIWTLLCLFGFVLYTWNPYLGLRTTGCLNMFSNLRTEGHTSNHVCWDRIP